ncbi:hypothetical protein J8C06_07325 [Chloracidobacterium validum]|uniref:Uncharacterized protein n=1 Tax=Chloracidobacterium validum TaxID=2821543 RepID=A0ABX8BAS8_9BACT|nr:hypothetical protein [Chloracidobacterium validum]QUW02175.1 hypothetical protein J8C06_07325 [Chloracidobacterium validum]
MPHANFCPACGEAIPPVPDTWQSHGRAALLGRRCPACGYRLDGPQWKTFGLGLILGLAAGVGNTVWQAVHPPPPLPPLTTSQALMTAGPTEMPAATISRERHRCGAKTKKGTPCQRWVNGTTGYCWQHRTD